MVMLITRSEVNLIKLLSELPRWWLFVAVAAVLGVGIFGAYLFAKWDDNNFGE